MHKHLDQKRRGAGAGRTVRQAWDLDTRWVSAAIKSKTWSDMRIPYFDQAGLSTDRYQQYTSLSYVKAMKPLFDQKCMRRSIVRGMKARGMDFIAADLKKRMEGGTVWMMRGSKH